MSIFWQRSIPHALICFKKLKGFSTFQLFNVAGTARTPAPSDTAAMLTHHNRWLWRPQVQTYQDEQANGARVGAQSPGHAAKAG
jgi:hypothetical protein